MLWLSRLRLRWRSLFRQDQADAGLSGELEFHLAAQKAELMDGGMSEADADAEARRMFGPVAALEEECRDQRRTRWLADFLQDCRYTLRSLGHAPAFAIVAVLTLALGIGANTAFFSTAYGILFRPLPYPEPGRLVDLSKGVYGMGAVLALRDISREVDYAGYLADADQNMQYAPGGEASRIHASTATWNLARVLGVAPARGRWFTREEERDGADRVVVISDRMWRERFGADPAILGRTLRLNERPYEVAGVMPPGFAFPSTDTEIWIPIHADPSSIGDYWGSGNLLPIGRLCRGATFETARREIKPAVDRVRALFPFKMPDLWGASAWPIPYAEALSEDVRPKLLALSAAALLLLLIACGNVGNLLLARSAGREREFAMREALGAGIGRLMRQLMAENLILTLGGGIGGFFAAEIILKGLPLLLPKDTPRLTEATPALQLFAIALLSMAGTIVLFSAAPLIRLWRGRRRDSLMTKAATASRRASRMSLALIGVELALATALLVGAALMGRTLWRLSNVDSGIHSAGVVSAQVAMGPSRCAKPDACLAMLDEIGRTVASEPGVRSVNWSNQAPLSREFSMVSSAVEDHPRPPSDPAFVLWQIRVSPGYFEALGIRLIAGRLLTDADRAGAPAVMVIGESTARRFWPNGSAVGKHIRLVWMRDWVTIVGVVADVAQYSLAGFPDWIDGLEYVPLAQTMSSGSVAMTALVTANRGITVPVAEAVRRQFPDVVVSHVETLEQIRAESVTDQRSTAWLLGLLASLGLLLGIGGVYGVISHRAQQRTREIGIRMAMGASGGGVIRMVLSETLAVSAAGALAGVAAAYASSRFLASLLFGVTAHDAVTFAACPVVLLIAAVVAAAVPAARASRTDPAITLREE